MSKNEKEIEREREEVTLRSKIKIHRDRIVWTNLHYMAYNVLKDPVSSERLHKLLEILPIYGMTCGKCRTHYEEFLSNYPQNISEIVSTKTNFARFLLDYHNSVNKSIGKREFSAQEAEMYYIENNQQILGSTCLERTLGDIYLDENTKIENFFKELDNSIRCQMNI